MFTHHGLNKSFLSYMPRMCMGVCAWQFRRIKTQTATRKKNNNTSGSSKKLGVYWISAVKIQSVDGELKKRCCLLLNHTNNYQQVEHFQCASTSRLSGNLLFFFSTWSRRNDCFFLLFVTISVLISCLRLLMACVRSKTVSHWIFFGHPNAVFMWKLLSQSFFVHSRCLVFL